MSRYELYRYIKNNASKLNKDEKINMVVIISNEEGVTVKGDSPIFIKSNNNKEININLNKLQKKNLTTIYNIIKNKCNRLNQKSF